MRKISLIGVFGVLTSLVLNPPSSRFALPFLPALIVSSVYYLNSLKSTTIRKIAICAIALSAFFVLVLRLYAFKKYVPFLLGRQSLSEFMAAHSSRLPGTFIDTDNFVARLPQGSKILVDKLHNLYYFPRDFDHTSWAEDRSIYDYLVTIGEEGTGAGKLIHENQIGIQVFDLKQ